MIHPSPPVVDDGGQPLNPGVPASPSGYSAEPEPSSTVSAVPVSIPNAMRAVSDGMARYIDTFLPRTDAHRGVSEEGITRHVLVGISLALISAASAIEARSDATGTGAAEGESAVPKGDAQNG